MCAAGCREAQGAESELASGIGPVSRSAGRVKRATPLLDEPEAQGLIENGLGCEQLSEPVCRISAAASIPVCRHKSRRNLGRCQRMKASGGSFWQTGEIFFCHLPAILAGEKASPRSLTCCRN